MLKLLAIVAILPIIFAASPMNRCAGNLPMPDAIFFGGRTSPCTAMPCPIFQSVGSGTTYIDFTTNRAITSILPELWARVIGLHIQHELPPTMVANPWAYLIGPNPIPANTRVTFNLTVPVPSDVSVHCKIFKNCDILC